MKKDCWQNTFRLGVGLTLNRKPITVNNFYSDTLFAAHRARKIELKKEVCLEKNHLAIDYCCFCMSPFAPFCPASCEIHFSGSLSTIFHEEKHQS